MADNKGAMQVDAALVRQLAELLDETNLTEIEVEDGDRKIRVARKLGGGNQAQAAAPPAAPAAIAPVPSAPTVAAGPDLTNALRSPMVGTCYTAPEPGAAPFVNVGDSVSEGQTLLIIEAMKVMNPIVATRAGKVQAVLIDNGQPVEFDQPLVILA